MEIYEAEEVHIPAIQRIYAYHVLHGTASFETEPPDCATIAARLAQTRDAGLLWLVVLHEGEVKGYCYLGSYRTRYAYRHTLEDSVYIDPTFQQRGAGRALLEHAIQWAEQKGYRQLVANIGDSENHGSLGLHLATGFTLVGTLKSVGFKQGRWLDTVLMQRTLGAGSTALPDRPQ